MRARVGIIYSTKAWEEMDWKIEEYFSFSSLEHIADKGAASCISNFRKDAGHLVTAFGKI